MSQPDPSSKPPSHPQPGMQNRRLSILQDAANDDLHNINTHALDSKSPPSHHEYSPNNDNTYECHPKSPLISRENSVMDVEKNENGAGRDKEGEEGYVCFRFVRSCFVNRALAEPSSVLQGEQARSVK